MALIFVAGTEDVGPIVELAVKGPTLEPPKIVHLAPKTAIKQLARKPKNLVATLSLTRVSGEIVEFPYGLEFFMKNKPDLFILLQCDKGDISQQTVNTHLALMSGTKAVKIIKMDRDNIKKVLLDIRKTLIQVLE